MQEKLKYWSNNAYVFCRSPLAESFKLSLIGITTRRKRLLNKLNVYRLQDIKCIVLSWASVKVFFTFQLVLVTKLWNLIKQFWCHPSVPNSSPSSCEAETIAMCYQDDKCFSSNEELLVVVKEIKRYSPSLVLGTVGLLSVNH